MVEIHIPLPRLRTVLFLLAIGGGIWWYQESKQADAMGGSGSVSNTSVYTVVQAEEDMRRLRTTQQVIDRREQILQANMDALGNELRRTDDPSVQRDLSLVRGNLLALYRDRQKTEEEIRQTLQQLWAAQGYAVHAAYGENADVSFVWPVEPVNGISATFHDQGYARKFGLAHNAIDIPVDQGSVVRSAADGIVEKVSDNGLGFNSVVIRHAGGYATLYGHVSAFLVKEGQAVRAGEAIALSGGRPGTPGAGPLTTGPHLHLELFQNGEHIDPMSVLPSI